MLQMQIKDRSEDNQDNQLTRFFNEDSQLTRFFNFLKDIKK